MTLKVELNAKVEAWLMAQAEAQGLSLEAYVGRLLEERSKRTVGGKRHPSRKSVVELFERLKGAARKCVVIRQAFSKERAVRAQRAEKSCLLKTKCAGMASVV